MLLNNRSNRNTTPNIVLSWKKLTLWTLKRKKKSWMSSLITRIEYEKQIILNNFDGQVENGAFVAILGPSGAGKTSFLAALAGRSSLRSSGQVLLNSRPWSELALRLSCLVPQHDMVTECLTVSEHLYFMSEMKLNKNMTKADKRFVLDRIVQQLGFWDKLGTSIFHLSGGERKALALATALLSGPRLIFCDEPTSGLDSYSASLVVELLRGQVAAGRIVVCSIHQPSSEIYYAFNTVILIAEARLVFQGSLVECMRFFEASNLRCPTSFNPAEYYLKILSQSAHNGDGQVSILAVKYNSILQEKYSMYNYDEDDHSVVNLCREISKPAWLKQVRLIMWRSAVEAKRSCWLHFIQLSINLVSAFMLCVAFWGLTGNTQEGIQNMHGFWWFVSSEVAFSIAYATLNAFNTDLVIFKRERDVYCCSAYYVARFLSLLPRCIVWPLLFLFVSTFGLALPMPVVIYWEMALALIVTSLASASYGLMLSALFASSGIEMDIAAPIDLVLFLVSGVFARVTTLPAWLSWIRFISHFFYAVEAVYAIYWTKVDSIDCPATYKSTCLTSGQQVLADNGFYTRYCFDAAGLLAIVVLWCVVGYLGLKRESRRSEY